VLARGEDRAERVADDYHPGTPECPTDCVITEEASVAHRADTRENRRKGAHHRDEAREDDRPATVRLVKVLRSRHISLFEEKRISALEKVDTDICSEPVAD